MHVRKLARTTMLAGLFSLALFVSSTLAETISGVGATFPQPLYTEYFKAFNNETGHKVIYQGLGSGAGIHFVVEQKSDFGATDAFIPDTILTTLDGTILHMPTCLGAVVMTYNLPGNPILRLTPGLIADIFLGKITSWDDPAIKQVNPDASLPALEISVVHRYDQSGTTHIVSSYLSTVSDVWRSQVGEGTMIDWPVGYGAKGNAGIALMIERVSGSIGYVEMTYARKIGLPGAQIQNLSGHFIAPDPSSVSLAGQVPIPADTRISITNTNAEFGYPISGFSWVLFYREQAYDERTREHAVSLIQLLNWMVDHGQELNEANNYAPLPAAARHRAREILQSVTYDGEPILPPPGASR